MIDRYCVILTTTGSLDEAERLAERLVAQRLAACVQIGAVSSRYVWKGEVAREPEHLLLIKTAARLYPEVQAAILENHSYEIPEILQLPVTQGLDRYLGWIEETIG